MSDSPTETLLAREAIRDLLFQLARGTDRRDRELILSCYHAGATDDHGGYVGDAEGFADWAPQALSIFEATQHVLGNMRIELDGDVAHTETYCTAHHLFPASDPGGARDSVMGLRYVDRFERRNGAWRIAARRCVYDYTYIVPIGEAWPLDPPFVVGRPDSTDPSYER